MRPPKIPKYCRHKHSNQAYMVTGREWHYLGEYNSPKSHKKYHRLLREFCKRHSHLKIDGMTIPAIAALFEQHSQIRHSGGTRDSYNRTIRTFSRLFPDLEASSVDCWHIEEFQLALVHKGLTANTINDYLARLKRIFRWAIRNQYLHKETLLYFEMLDRVDRTWAGVNNPERIKPIAIERVNQILPDLPPTIAALVKFQLFTGCRPGEARTLRLCDLDTSKDVWLYTPQQHKTSHLGKNRVVYVGPLAQQVIEAQGMGNSEAYLFHSGDPSSCYSTPTFARAIRRACERANLTPHWTPNQLRHTHTLPHACVGGQKMEIIGLLNI